MTRDEVLEEMLTEAKAAKNILADLIQELEGKEDAAAERIKYQEHESGKAPAEMIARHNALYRVLLTLDECQDRNKKLVKALELISESAYCKPDTARDIPWA